ncbi:DUF1499 domain-containing protein [Arenibacterium halophilum]|uniref:DUF1499 domain-containing protein n=1 Tax=Arenibacterium halophilum TaxID=2583821 RepID=A0ABY2XB22_9RHOB|nr:DUF1499 domain-containing protein [Arenibacterium halophilum]TMV13572.1 DUF1499 domain-containing protein [Arenibacterium halophilum]
MSRILMLAWIVLCVVVVAVGYVRLVPTRAADWHIPLDEQARAGTWRELPAGPDTLEQLDVIARATPRTRVLAGSLTEGRYTYITRSAIIGFPDFTTVEQQDAVVRIHARQRFGSSDLGVNAARVDGWLQALQAR